MDAKQFFYEVAKMRNFQKEYFKTRSAVYLAASKKQEKLIDAEIDRVESVMQEKDNSKLFQ
jgi:hypothetical protein